MMMFYCLTHSESLKSKLMKFSAYTVRKQEIYEQCILESTGSQVRRSRFKWRFFGAKFLFESAFIYLTVQMWKMLCEVSYGMCLCTDLYRIITMIIGRPWFQVSYEDNRAFDIGLKLWREEECRKIEMQREDVLTIKEVECQHYLPYFCLLTFLPSPGMDATGICCLCFRPLALPLRCS